MRGPPETSFPSQPTDVRSYFVESGCHIHGHPSSGGILIKRSANLVDLQFLSLPRTTATFRSHKTEEEDEFCELMRRIGATWWDSEAAYLRALLGEDVYDGDPNDEEPDPDVRAINSARARKIITFGWPADGLGVWILKFKNQRQAPRDYAKINFAIDMAERIDVMKQFGANFVEDLSDVDELQEVWSHQPLVSSHYYIEDDSDTDEESCSSNSVEV